MTTSLISVDQGSLATRSPTDCAGLRGPTQESSERDSEHRELHEVPTDYSPSLVGRSSDSPIHLQGSPGWPSPMLGGCPWLDIGSSLTRDSLSASVRRGIGFERKDEVEKTRLDLSSHLACCCTPSAALAGTDCADHEPPTLSASLRRKPPVRSSTPSKNPPAPDLA